MDDREAYEFYLDPGHLKPAGPGRRRKRPVLSSMVPVRFAPEVAGRVKRFAHAEGITVSAWMRRAVMREEERERRKWLDAHRHELEVIPGSGRAVTPRALPSSLTSLTVSSSGGRTFACPDMSIGGVVSASCGTCGPLAAVA